MSCELSSSFNMWHLLHGTDEIQFRKEILQKTTEIQFETRQMKYNLERNVCHKTDELQFWKGILTRDKWTTIFWKEIVARDRLNTI